MKIGSLVECINNIGCENTPPVLGVIYTVRAIHEDGMVLKNGVIVFGVGIQLEELRNKSVYSDGSEKYYRTKRFRELLPPIANIEEHINQNTLEPQLI